MADEGEVRRVRVPLADLRDGVGEAAGLDTQLLHGEDVRVLAAEGGLAHVRALLDGYEGWCRADDLAPPGPRPTHRVSARATLVFPAPDIKAPGALRLSLGARVAVAEGGVAGRGTRRALARLASGGYAIEHHLAPLAQAEADWVAAAERCLGAPYLWGGRSSDGLDCSALVQLALQAGGHACPRDTGPQSRWVVPLDAGAGGGQGLARGDLVFWAGHVGIMLDGARLLHANAHHMAVAVEPLADAVARIAAAGGGEPTLRGRLPV